MWRVSIIVILIAVAAFWVTGDWWVSLVAGIVFTTVILALKAGIVIVPERRAAVIFNRLRFYTGLRGPGIGFILPFWERVGFRLDLGPKPAQITVHDILTRDHVPLTVSLSLIYRLNPWQMRSGLQLQLMDLLQLSAPTILQREVEHLLRKLISEQEATTLLRPQVRGYLEDCLTKELPGHVEWFGVMISGQVMLGKITLPERSRPGSTWPSRP